MKKISSCVLLSTAFLCLSSGVALSRPLVCPFTDTFDITGSKIQSLSVVGNLKVKKVSATEFTAGCADNRSSNDGTISLKVIGASAQNECSLTILDGPYEMDPTVTGSTCQGLQYNGMDHSWGTYSYLLKFGSTKN